MRCTKLHCERDKHVPDCRSSKSDRIAVGRRSGSVLRRAHRVRRCSEENQAGWEWHDTSLVDPETGQMDTLGRFRHTISDAGLEDVVVAVVGQSPLVARHWSTPIGFLFIDGGHGVEPARLDYLGWAPHVAAGGLFAIHDVFDDPALGGQAPNEQIYRPAIDSGLFEQVSVCGSLRVLRRL